LSFDININIFAIETSHRNIMKKRTIIISAAALFYALFLAGIIISGSLTSYEISVWAFGVGVFLASTAALSVRFIEYKEGLRLGVGSMPFWDRTLILIWAAIVLGGVIWDLSTEESLLWIPRALFWFSPVSILFWGRYAISLKKDMVIIRIETPRVTKIPLEAIQAVDIQGSDVAFAYDNGQKLTIPDVLKADETEKLATWLNAHGITVNRLT
jgi:hypothetical protein